MVDDWLQPASKVLTVRAQGNSDAAEIIPAAKNVCREVRRLGWSGYDLRRFEIRAHLVRDDKPVEPGQITAAEILADDVWGR